MSFLNKLFGKGKAKYSDNTDLVPSGMDDINPFEIRKPLQETLSVVIPLGGSFSYTYSVHGSVGYWWKSEFDKSAFDMRPSQGYLDPERCKKMCGADAAIRCETFTALEKGDFQVIIHHEFRGKEIYTTTINVKVC